MNSTSTISGSGDPWYVIHCKSRRELFAANILRNQLGLSIFFPESSIRVRGEVRHIPLFPGYLFVQVDLQKVAASSINTSPGVLHLVTFGGDPQSVSRHVIETIFEEVNRLNMVSGLAQHGFCAGDHVRVKDGALQDLEMVFVGPMTPSKRVRVLLYFLGRAKEVHIEVEALEKLPGNPHFQGELSA